MNDQKPRRLAAIMFTDIVGYTALMQRDEETAAKVRSHHREVFNEQHKAHHGEILQYYGDGTLSVFQSVVEAVECAIKIQQLLQQGEPVPLRIGIHLGDIVFDRTEVYGDGVNVASRIESMGVAGAILLSKAINDELKNHQDISTVSLGQFSLKNIANPIEVFAVTNEQIKVPRRSDLKGKQSKLSKSIAVLPFVNMSANEDNEYFSDGITEEIINALSKIKKLKVTSRTSSFFFKNKKIPLSQIGQELNVATILEGSVRLSGNMMRITAQLINVADDFHFWSETWDRKLESVFAIQDEISLLIAEKLREHLGHFEIQDHLVSPQTENIEAYEFYLKGRYHFLKWSPVDIQLGIGYLEKAIALDPSHAESYTSLAYCYTFLAQLGFLPAKKAFAKAESYLLQALAINDQLPEVYFGLASSSFWKDWDFESAFSYLDKALKSKPSDPTGHLLASLIFLLSGDIETALARISYALRLDPLSPHCLFIQAWIYYIAEDFEKALEALRLAKARFADLTPLQMLAGYILLLEGQYDEAVSFINSHPDELLDLPTKYGMSAIAYAKKQDQANTQKYLGLLREQLQQEHAERAEAFIFMIQVVSGQMDEAIAWMEREVENKAPLIILLIPDPIIKPLRSDPRYKKLVKKIFGPGLSQQILKKNSLGKKVHKKKPLLDKATNEAYTEKLLTYIAEKAPHLDANISLRSLAEQLDMHPNQLSWLLNERLGENFNDFINHYRLEAFKRLAQDPKNAHLTLIGLAYESGFNSKTVFNTFFKREMGMTPKQYLKQIN